MAGYSVVSYLLDVFKEFGSCQGLGCFIVSPREGGSIPDVLYESNLTRGMSYQVGTPNKPIEPDVPGRINQ